MKKLHRCEWNDWEDKLYRDYHDKEWGVPVHKDRKLFEFLILEGQQAGLSWSTVLKKRKNYKKAFDNFDFEKIATYDAKKITSLLKNEGLIRNKLKINSIVKNAKVFKDIRKEFGSFDKYFWSFVENNPIQNKYKHCSEIPAKTPLAEKISKDLKKRGMSFVGPTIIYAYMQAVGMVNDHQTNCFRYKEVKTN